MKLIYFLWRHSRVSLILSVLFGTIAGACNVGLIALVHRAMSKEGGSAPDVLWIFGALCLLVPITRITSQALLVHLAQSAMYKLLMQFSRQILATPLRQLEKLGNHRLLVALTDDLAIIADGLVLIPSLCLYNTILVGCLVYLAWLSYIVFAGVICFIVVVFSSSRLANGRAANFFSHARENKDELFSHLRALTEGTKELKLHRERREAFFSHLLTSAADSFRRNNLTSHIIYTATASWNQFLFFTFIGLLLFALPFFKDYYNLGVVTGSTLILLYMLVPIDIISNALSGLSRADVALKKLQSLGLLLEGKGLENKPPYKKIESSWRRLEIVGATHSYHVENASREFVLGPINLAFHPEELVFITGGNGSGKTTFVKLLTGLYTPEAGEIRLDGHRVSDKNRDYYRQYFSVVFSDFYLFERLLGLEFPELDSKARSYLAQLQLDGKVEVKNGLLSTIALSQGQRKRLALLTAFLEDRPIYVFDEWAADQDPMFKDVFYMQLLPELKAGGKTVLVITHDERYYHVADRVIRLESGKVEYDEKRKPYSSISALTAKELAITPDQ